MWEINVRIFKSVGKIHSINDAVPPGGTLVVSPLQLLNVVCALHPKGSPGVELSVPMITSLIFLLFWEKLSKKTFVQQPQTGIINQ